MVSHLTKSENMNLWPCVLGGIGVGIAFTLGYKEIFSLEDSNEKPKYAAPSKFLYFNIEGAGEKIRRCLKYMKIPFIDKRFVDRNEFLKLKKDGTLTFGQVPALELSDGTMLFQSQAIMRYIGRYAAEVLKDERLYPISQPKVCAVIDALCCQDDDIQIGLRAYRYGRNGFDFDNLPALNGETAKKSIAKRLCDEVYPQHLARLEKIISNSKTGWFAGTATPTIADFTLFPTVEWIDRGIDAKNDVQYFRKGLVNKYPNLMKWMSKFNNEVLERL